MGLGIFLCLRKRSRAIRQNSRIEEEEKPKTKDVEQSYSLVEERWFVAFKYLQTCISAVTKYLLPKYSWDKKEADAARLTFILAQAAFVHPHELWSSILR